jgi:hypothetical protein
MTFGKQERPMSSSSSSSSSGGIGFFGLLTILFIALKLIGYIDWSWWWVLSPIWGALLFVVVLIAGVVGGMAVKEIRADRKRVARRNERLR